MKKYLIIAIVVLFAALSGTGWLLYREHQEKLRIKGNQDALMEENRVYRLRDSSQVSSTQALQFTKKEFKQYIDSSQSVLLKQMDVKIRQVQSIASATITTEGEARTSSRDTIIYMPGNLTPIKAGYWKWKDDWISLETIEVDTNRFINYLYKEKMDQVVYRERVGWKFWKRKPVRQDIHFSNKNTKIDYNQYIEIQKSGKK